MFPLACLQFLISWLMLRRLSTGADFGVSRETLLHSRTLRAVEQCADVVKQKITRCNESIDNHSRDALFRRQEKSFGC